MTDSQAPRTTGPVTVGDVELWVDQRGSGPDVLLCAGLSDPAEAWEFQLQGLSDRYRVTAFDNRGAGRSPMMPVGFTVADMADDAAGILREVGISAAHVAGFSGGSLTAQWLALRHPRAGPKPGANQHLGPTRRLPAGLGDVLREAGGRGPE